MKNQRIGIPSPGVTFSIVAVMLLSASAAWATTAPCATTAPLSSYGSGDGSGCYEIDQSFTNFSVAGSSTIGTTQTTSTDEITGSSNFSAPATPFLVYGTFTPASAADWQATGTGSGGTVEGTINYLVDSEGNEIPFASNPQYPGSPTPTNLFQITSVSIGLEATTGTTEGDSIAVSKTLCVGTAACTTGPSGDSAVLTVTMTSLGGSSSELVYGCTVGSGFQGACGGGNSTVDISSGFSAATLNVTDQYTLTVAGSDTDALNSFVDFFGEEETPEPSTFVLLGTALAGIWFLRFRRRKAS